MIVGDLFSGVGGLSQGFIEAGFKIGFAIEYDKQIAKSYKLNHQGVKVFTDDICNLDINEIKKDFPTIDIIVGGPPCQGFSQKGKRLNLSDDRNYLFQQFVRYVREFQPKYFVLENVPNIITTSKGFFKDEIIDSFNKLGYDVCYDTLYAVNFGVPQDRKRAIFLGQKNKLEIELPKSNGIKVTIEEAIYDLPFIGSGEGSEVSDYDKKPKTEYQKRMRQSSSTLYNHVATNHSAEAIQRLKLIPKGMGREVLPREYRTKSIYSGTWSRLLEDGVAPTITTRFDTPSSGRFTHPILNRCLTVREGARLQSFKDSFRFYGNRTSQMKQVGNAVPPILAYEIAKVIAKNENIIQP